MAFDFTPLKQIADSAKKVVYKIADSARVRVSKGMNPSDKTQNKMNSINEQSAGQKFYSVCSKQAGSPDFIGVWAYNKTEAKKAFKARNPKVAMKDIQASPADY